MTTSFRKLDEERGSRGFTLVELMIAMSLGSMILAAVLTAFIMIGRSAARVVNYSVMEAQTRRAFEQLAIDARMANAFLSYPELPATGPITSFTMTIPGEDTTPSRLVTYGYDTTDSSDKKFYFVPGPNGSTVGRVNLITGLKDLTILRYTGATPPVLIPTTSNSTGIKHLQVSVSVSRSGGRVVETTQVMRSTAFTLRNM